MYFWSWDAVIMVMKYVDRGHEFMTMVIIFSTLVVKFVHVVIKLAQFWLILVFREWFLRGLCLCFHEFYSQYTKKSALLVVSALRRVPATSYTFSFRRLHGLSSNPMVSLFANGLSGCFCYSVHGQHRGLLAARHTCGKKQLSVWCVGAQILFFVQTHRLVPCTRLYVLLCGRYSR